MAFSSCNEQSNKAVASINSIEADTLRPKSAQSNMYAEFNMDQVPVSPIDIGTFPYLSVPEGYKYSGDTKKQLEEKYFFYNDSLVRKVSGEYFTTNILSTNDSFEDTFLISEYKKAITKLGGIEIYSGGLPAAASELIDKENPAYVSDMYDPRPYRYKQFLIKTAKENVWIELCHGLNSQLIDLTVVKEERLNEH